ncbi:MAG TPA: hypothetical protein VGE18_00930 [Candidatus Paceibacterota bacterium]
MVEITNLNDLITFIQRSFLNEEQKEKTDPTRDNTLYKICYKTPEGIVHIQGMLYGGGDAGELSLIAGEEDNLLRRDDTERAVVKMIQNREFFSVWPKEWNDIEFDGLAQGILWQRQNSAKFN